MKDEIMEHHKVFYSWQSDLPEKSNRHAIWESLKKAKKTLNCDSWTIEPDQATRGETGSPRIFGTILKKIKQSDVFVCDVSLTNSVCSCLNGIMPVKKTPNPNVMIELGYALSIIGWERVIMLFNTEYGIVADLPFDIRDRLIHQYQCTDENIKEVIPNLSGALASKIRDIISANPRKPILTKELDEEKTKRDRDVKFLTGVLSYLDTQALFYFINVEAPKFRSHYLVTMIDVFEAYLSGQHYHIYDLTLSEKIKNLAKAIDESLAFGECFETLYSSNRFVFKTPGDVFSSDEEEEKYNLLESARLRLYYELNGFLSYIKDNYLEINIDDTNKAAFEFCTSKL